MILHPEVAKAPLDEVYLDTTYLNPQYCFPPQPVVIASVSKLARSLVLGGAGAAGPAAGLAGWVKRDESAEANLEREEKARLRGSRTLVAVGTYSIGKERIVKGPFATFFILLLLACLTPKTDAQLLGPDEQASPRRSGRRSLRTRASAG